MYKTVNYILYAQCDTIHYLHNIHKIVVLYTISRLKKCVIFVLFCNTQARKCLFDDFSGARQVSIVFVSIDADTVCSSSMSYL